MIILRQKFYTTLKDGGGKPMLQYKQQFDQAGGKEKLGMSFTDWYKGGNTGVAADNNKIAQEAAAREARRKANKTLTQQNPNALKSVATKARTQGYNNGYKQGQQSGFQQGQESVGLKQGAVNTWKNMSTAGKVATGVAAGALALGTTKLISDSIKNKRRAKEAEERERRAEDRAMMRARY